VVHHIKDRQKQQIFLVPSTRATSFGQYIYIYTHIKFVRFHKFYIRAVKSICGCIQYLQIFTEILVKQGQQMIFYQ